MTRKPPSVLEYRLDEPYRLMIGSPPGDPVGFASRLVLPDWAAALRALGKALDRLMAASPMPEEFMAGLRNGSHPAGQMAWLGVTDGRLVLLVAPERWCVTQSKETNP